MCRQRSMRWWIGGRFPLIPKRGLGRSGEGPSGDDPPGLFKCPLIGQWHGLSDPKLERALKVRMDFMIFCGLDLHAPVPPLGRFPLEIACRAMDGTPVAGSATRW